MSWGFCTTMAAAGFKVNDCKNWQLQLPSAAHNTHQPMRTCVGCGGKSPRHTLIRLAVSLLDASPGGEPVVHVDSEQKHPGRGAWVHATLACAQNAVRRGRLWHTLRARPTQVEQLEAELARAVNRHPRGDNPTDTESG